MRTIVKDDQEIVMLQGWKQLRNGPRNCKVHL